jgi:hypothetical protein
MQLENQESEIYNMVLACKLFVFINKVNLNQIKHFLSLLIQFFLNIS